MATSYGLTTTRSGNTITVNSDDWPGEGWLAVLNSLDYQARIINRVTQAVIWTSFSFQGGSEVDVEYYGALSTLYDLEVKLLSYPNGQWHAVGKFYNQVCSVDPGFGIEDLIEEIIAYPNPNNGFFTLKRTQQVNNDVTASKLLTQKKSSERLTVRIYSFSTVALVKEMQIVLSDETAINTGKLPKGKYIVQVVRDNTVIHSSPMMIE